VGRAGTQRMVVPWGRAAGTVPVPFCHATKSIQIIDALYHVICKMIQYYDMYYVTHNESLFVVLKMLPKQN
jgi:hypothetical protein